MRKTRGAVRRLLAAGLFVGCGLAATGCPNTSPDPNDPNGGAGAVSFAADIVPILTAHCAGCHSPGGFAFTFITMDLRAANAYQNLVGVASVQASGRVRIVPGDATASYLIEKVTQDQPQVGARMPLNRDPLSEAEIALLRDWIDAGAPNN
ncbi:MAG: hypothetical protein LC135_07620 [Phycisphaerae bacterium]|nr:hypothetical protein [Phycisphaerae bacterium]MCZ2399722.1 hypothetical protein [Phycisphaerae bacterium]NUQ50334.1 hypothetical protein [Phycisphaerae bacterium]